MQHSKVIVINIHFYRKYRCVPATSTQAERMFSALGLLLTVCFLAWLLPAVAQTEGGELQWGRSCQALVPDFRIQLPTPEGPTFSLAELKICGAGKTWCLRGQEGRRKYRRAAGLIKLY